MTPRRWDVARGVCSAFGAVPARHRAGFSLAHRTLQHGCEVGQPAAMFALH